jgi:ABC-type antimicrobial peptide transport system permease subunit
MAQQLWPNEDPLGKRIQWGDLASNPDSCIIIGVVGRIKQDALDTNSRIAMYAPQTQYISRAMNIVLRTNTDPAALASAVNHELHELDSDLPVYRVLSMQQRIAGSLARRRFATTLLGVFACLALALASIGIYSVLAYLVSQGTRELGIRMALGATQRNVVALIVTQGMKLAIVGVAVGIVVAFALGRLIGGFLFGVQSTDLVTFAATSILLAIVAALASYIPARRAARIDPMISLRSD